MSKTPLASSVVEDDDEVYNEEIKQQVRSRCEQIYRATFGRPWRQADWPSGEQLKQQPKLARKVVELLLEQQNKTISLLADFETQIGEMLEQCEKMTGASHSLLAKEIRSLKRVRRALIDNIVLVQDAWGSAPEAVSARTSDHPHCEVGTRTTMHPSSAPGEGTVCRSGKATAMDAHPVSTKPRARVKPTLEDVFVQPLNSLLDFNRHWLADRTVHEREWPIAFPETESAIPALLCLLQNRGAGLPPKERKVKAPLRTAMNAIRKIPGNEPKLTNEQLGAIAILCGAYEVEVMDGDDAGSVLHKAAEGVRIARARLFERPDKRKTK